MWFVCIYVYNHLLCAHTYIHTYPIQTTMLGEVMVPDSTLTSKKKFMIRLLIEFHKSGLMTFRTEKLLKRIAKALDIITTCTIQPGTHAHLLIHTFIDTYAYVVIRTCTHTCICSEIYTLINILTYSYILIHIHTYS